MRVIEAPATVRSTSDEVLYILEKDEGIHLPPGAEVEICEKATVLSVRADSSRPGNIHKVRMLDAPVQRTGDRWYRELIQSEITQFVGSIPPGRAPDHFHLYEEVLCILGGRRLPVGGWRADADHQRLMRLSAEEKCALRRE